MRWRGKVAFFGGCFLAGYTYLAAGDNPYSECEKWLAPPGSRSDITSHFHALQNLPKRHRLSRHANPHYDALIETAKIILDEAEVPYSVDGGGALKIEADGESAQKPVHKIAGRLRATGFRLRFDPKALLKSGIGGEFDSGTRSLNLDYRLITGELDDLIIHEIRHIHHFRTWQAGRRSRFDFSVESKNAARVSAADTYKFYFTSEELDCYKHQLIYLFREVNRHQARAHEPETRPFFESRYKRIWSNLVEVIELSRAALRWNLLASAAVDKAIENFDQMKIVDDSSRPGEVILAKTKSLTHFFADRDEAGTLAVNIALRDALVTVKLPEAAEFFANHKYSRREAARMLRRLGESLAESQTLARTHLEHFERLREAMKDHDWPRAFTLGAHRVQAD